MWPQTFFSGGSRAPRCGWSTGGKSTGTLAIPAPSFRLAVHPHRARPAFLGSAADGQIAGTCPAVARIIADELTQFMLSETRRPPRAGGNQPASASSHLCQMKEINECADRGVTAARWYRHAGELLKAEAVLHDWLALPDGGPRDQEPLCRVRGAAPDARLLPGVRRLVSLLHPRQVRLSSTPPGARSWASPDWWGRGARR